MEVRLTPGGTTVPEAPPGEGLSVRQVPAAKPREVLPHRDSGASVQDRPAGLDKEDLKDLLKRTTELVSALDLPLDAVAIRQAPLEGQVLLNIKKLDFLDALTAQQSRWSGALNGELQLAGTVDMPQFLGHLELERGEVLVPALGLHLAPLKALVRGSEGRLSAEVEAQAREGRIRLEGGVDLGGNSLNYEIGRASCRERV